ncbi:MFS transporter [Streptomyces sp. HNM0574]|uniref:MFS transporter n=1 Tax=Streptomyces sp. HNM0574 TaxID=2714954 RepID=UPI00146E0666|nr:MFS transporter [Streptomyces sp. HNM0574]NLU71025.1 MFS transporter [Streptomyces sp. HNM0574]
MTSRPAVRVHPAWGMLALVLLGLLTAQGTRIAFGAFVPAWQDDLDVSRGTISLVGTASFVIYGLTQPLVGRLSDRYGARAVLSAGVVVAGLGLVASSQAPDVAWLAVLYGLLASLGFSAASGVTAGLVVSQWFTTRRGVAFSFVESGFGAGQFVFVPLSLALIDAYGWSTTLAVEGAALMLVVGPLIAVLLRSAPAEKGLEPYGGPAPAPAGEEPAGGGGAGRRVLRSPVLWALVAPFFVCGVTTTGLIDTHLVPLAHDHGNSTALTGTTVSLLAAANITGILASGPLSDRYNCARILAVLYGVRTLSLILLAMAPHGGWLVAFAVVFGLVDFATVTPTHLIATRHFPPAALGLVFGFLSMGHQLGSAVGSYVPGLLHDLTGSYTTTLIGCSAALFGATLVCLAVLPARSVAPTAAETPEPASPVN